MCVRKLAEEEEKKRKKKKKRKRRRRKKKKKRRMKKKRRRRKRQRLKIYSKVTLRMVHTHPLPPIDRRNNIKQKTRHHNNYYN